MAAFVVQKMAIVIDAFLFKAVHFEKNGKAQKKVLDIFGWQLYVCFDRFLGNLEESLREWVWVGKVGKLFYNWSRLYLKCIAIFEDYNDAFGFIKCKTYVSLWFLKASHWTLKLFLTLHFLKNKAMFATPFILPKNQLKLSHQTPLTPNQFPFNQQTKLKRTIVF